MRMIILLLVLATAPGCQDYSPYCIELWEAKTAEKVPVSYEFAKRCCSRDEDPSNCVAAIWANNNGKK